MERSTKTMKIEKFRSGYRVRKTYKGKTYSILFDHKPTQKEAMLLMAEKLENISDRGGSMSFETAAFNYIESKSSVLSPSTIREYSSCVLRYSDSFRKLNIYEITLEDVQREVNELSKTKSPKTVRNYNALVSSVISFYRPGVNFPVTLPQRVKNEPYIPSDEDVKRILSFATDTEFEIPIRLACYGLRRSEICALSIDDLDGNILNIDKALVQNKNREFVLKTTKTEESTRSIYIDDALANLIRSKGYIYNGYPDSIARWLGATQKKLKIEHFGLHKLRHYYASMAHALGIPDAYIMQAGGWKTDNVMKTVYRHALKDKTYENMERVASHISKLG